MAVLTIKKASAGDYLIKDVGVVIPGAGEDTFADPKLILKLAVSRDLRAQIAAAVLVINDGTGDLSIALGTAYLNTLWAQAGNPDGPVSSFIIISPGGILWKVTISNAGAFVIAAV